MIDVPTSPDAPIALDYDLEWCTVLRSVVMPGAKNGALLKAYTDWLLRTLQHYSSPPVFQSGLSLHASPWWRHTVSQSLKDSNNLPYMHACRTDYRPTAAELEATQQLFVVPNTCCSPYCAA